MLTRIVSVFCLACISFMLACGGGPTNPTTKTPDTTQKPDTLTTFTNFFDAGGIQVPFTMVGTDPAIAGASTTTIPVQLIPISFNIGGTIVSPTLPACGDSVDAVTRTVNSPLFQSTWSDDATSAPTQFTDAFQRANLWKFVGSISPNYHILLQPVTVSAPVTVPVPTGAGSALFGGACLHPTATIQTTFMNSIMDQIIADQHIPAGTLPVFLTSNTEFIPDQFFGYHASPDGVRTLVAASYLDPGILGPQIEDVLPLSHELAEWINNPFGRNIVPAWPGPQGCSPLLEVGDALAQNGIPFPSNGFVYHVQELAYFSWFARNVPSIAINGRYSSRASFLTPAPPCI